MADLTVGVERQAFDEPPEPGGGCRWRTTYLRTPLGCEAWPGDEPEADPTDDPELKAQLHRARVTLRYIDGSGAVPDS